MFDPRVETPLTFSKAVRLNWLVGRDGRPLHKSAVYRWKADGLEVAVIGGQYVTSEAALLRHFAKKTADRLGIAANSARTARARDAAIRRADDDLDAAGIA